MLVGRPTQLLKLYNFEDLKNILNVSSETQQKFDKWEIFIVKIPKNLP